jgi:hypothetical protein
MNPDKGKGGRSLQKGSRLAIHRRIQEIPCRGVANIQANTRLEGSNFHEIGRPKIARFLRWVCGKGQR